LLHYLRQNKFMILVKGLNRPLGSQIKFYVLKYYGINKKSSLPESFELV